jgi:hypothetical protein
MQLTKIDVIFLQQVMNMSQHNRENEDKKALRVSKAHLSPELLQLVGVESDNNTGKWFFNVYVEFVPFVSEHPAMDWQK